ncbi:type 2 lanthipeptide synthetase LanM family protein [Candidatus Entotheonella palauensis]|uniref:type 2 lanthipeptide synthetase LanM family protein n=1 Tax=Candidatus Entotheonella palauensis TaxID=93172 RepID=UPI000B7EF7EB|nr:type 2 lanthipeptide synthetase LanM family protein [Candidatus Entotheonella palauensis]
MPSYFPLSAIPIAYMLATHISPWYLALTESERAALTPEASLPLSRMVELDQTLDRPTLSTASAHSLHTEDKPGFLDAIEPLIQHARDRLRAGIQKIATETPEVPFDPDSVEAIFVTALPARLLPMLSPTLVLELHVARLQGFLQGESPEARFASFIERLRQRENLRALMHEYPVLARQLMRELTHWVDSSLQFLQRLCADWSAIRTALHPHGDPGHLVSVDSQAGDRHRGGQSVHIATFSHGFQVVYKPRSLAVDLHMQDLLAWLNARGVETPFRILKVLDRGTYGWAEYIETQSCETPDELRRFYARQGGYLAVLYALEAVDFHCENLIAAGEHPVLIDVEALFHPRLDFPHGPQVRPLAAQLLHHSVLRVGLLPCVIWANEESEGIDISGLGSVAGQLTPYPMPRWEGAGTDQMHLICERRTMRDSQHQPTLNGEAVDAVTYTDAIAAGFTHVYRLLLEHREALLAVQGPLARFAHDDVRVILRATRTYAVLLHESFHPDVMRDALDRDRLFDHLWTDVPPDSPFHHVIEAEKSELHNGDIPLFTSRPDARDLWSRPTERLPHVLADTGLAQARQRIEQLSEDDLSQQLWVLRASMASLAPAPPHPASPPPQASGWQGPADQTRLMIAARAVGDRLEMLAQCHADEVAWLGITARSQTRWSLQPLGMELYDGLPGITLFLAYLGALTHETRYTTLAQTAVKALCSQATALDAPAYAIGAFTGYGGILYTLAHVAALWDQPDLLAAAEVLVERLPAWIEQDTHFDVISGAAGCVGSLLSLYQQAPAPRTLEVAVQCGDWLLRHAQPMAHGVGWLPAFPAKGPLSGFSHGAAGIAWALLNLGARTGEARFIAGAREAMAYERTLFSPTAGNWLDLRELNGLEHQLPSGCMTAWCHGAPGIGLARLQALRHLEDTQLHHEIDVALQTTLKQGFGTSHGLCHGALGNLELLIRAAQTPGYSSWREQAEGYRAMILDQIERQGWRCSTPFGLESPGLMTGLAGIGYGLLRLAEPERMPSVLALEPPHFISS